MKRIAVQFKPSFVRALKKLEPLLQDEAIEKIEYFKDPRNHKQLRVHPLKGRLKGRYSFSVNYRYRIVFSYLNREKTGVVLLSIGDHTVYDV